MKFTTTRVQLVSICLISITLPWLPGCSDGGSTGRVAVVDLDKISERLGVTKQLQTTLKEYQDPINQKMLKAQQDAQKMLSEKVEEAKQADEKSRPKASQEVALLQSKLNLRLRGIQIGARRGIAIRRRALVAKVRAAFLPFVQEVAAAQKFELVLTANSPGLYHHAQTSDITEAVGDAFAKSGKKVDLTITDEKPAASPSPGTNASASPNASPGPSPENASVPGTEASTETLGDHGTADEEPVVINVEASEPPKAP